MASAFASLPSVASMLLVTYATVLLAELVGDKSVYTIAALGLRFRFLPVVTGITLAFAGKMLAAVLFAKLLLQVSGSWTNILSALGFFVCAGCIWLKERGKPAAKIPDPTIIRTIAISFSSIFFTEWCDTGQIAAAALAARSQALAVVWAGGTLALLTKGTLALILGGKLSALIPENRIRIVASISYSILGLVSLAPIVFN